MNETMTRDEYYDLAEEFINRLEAYMNQIHTLLQDPTYEPIIKGEDLSFIFGVYTRRHGEQVQTTVLGGRRSVMTNIKNLCTEIDPELMERARVMAQQLNEEE